MPITSKHRWFCVVDLADLSLANANNCICTLVTYCECKHYFANMNLVSFAAAVDEHDFKSHAFMYLFTAL